MLTEELARQAVREPAGGHRTDSETARAPITVIGTFKEKTNSFGMSELTGETVLIPIPVLRYFTSSERIDPLYVQVRMPRMCRR